MRAVEFDRALRAEVHDPLWFLGRQWQFGEHKGEDAGSPITARLTYRATPIDEVAIAPNQRATLSSSVPLEAVVERIQVEPDAGARAQAGRVLFMMVERALKSLAAPPADQVRALRAALAATYPLDEPSPGSPAAAAWRAVREKERRLRTCLGASAIDGHAAFRAFELAAHPSGSVDWARLPASLALHVTPAQAPSVLEALERFRRWYPANDATSTTPAIRDAPMGAWDASRLEYRFGVTLARDESLVAIDVPEHTGGRLDWYAFEVGSTTPAPNASAAPWVPLTVLPAPAEFAGMPNPRFWQLEDGSVDLGNLRADTTDIARIVVAEFALVFGNDWSIIPLSLDRGTLAELQGIVVTDVFGQRTLVRSANDSGANAWSRWDFFSLSGRGHAQAGLGQHLFLPPVIPASDESDPIEQVAFLRDETANLIWGIEQRIGDGVGGSLDGNDAARRVAQRLQAAEGAGDAIDVHRYVLGTSVPENWIPFVPVHRPLDTREIRLQRASMPRFTPPREGGDGVAPIRPRTELLRVNIRPDDTQAQPYFLNEEEVPRGGLTVSASWQRVRWHGGETFVWLGRAKRSGAGEGGSGLRFDVLREPKRV